MGTKNILMLFLSVLLFVSLSDQVPIEAKASGNANNYLDKVLSNVRELIYEKNMDPFTTFNETLLGVKFLGQLKNLGSLHRTGDSSMHFDKGSGKIIVESSFRILEVNAKLNWKTHILLLVINGNASADISEIVVSLKLTADIQSRQAKIETFHIDKIGKITTHLQAVPIVNQIAATLTNVIVNFVKNHVTFLLEGPIKNMIQSVLDKNILPSSF